MQLITNIVLVFHKNGDKYLDELKNSFVVKPYEKVVDPKSEIKG